MGVTVTPWACAGVTVTPQACAGVPRLSRGNRDLFLSCAGVSRVTRVTVSSPKHREAAKQHPQVLQVPWVVLSREQESLDVSVFTLYPEGQLGRPQ